jgi:VanZ family protein
MTRTPASAEQPVTSSLVASGGRPAHLRLATLWWVAGWALVVLIAYSTLAPAKDVPTLHIWDKLEHAGAFFGMTFWFAGLVRRRRYPALAAWMLLFGGAIEIAQGTMGFGRDMDIHDFYADAIGIGCALALAYGGLGGWMRYVERSLGLARESS